MKKKYYIIDIKTREVLGRYSGDYYFEDMEDISIKYDLNDTREEAEKFLEEASEGSDILEDRLLEIKEVYIGRINF
jgi:hypothetical protein